MHVEYYQEPSPLDYYRSRSVHRFAMFSPEMVNVPFHPRDVYFAETERVIRYGKNNRRLKKPRVEITPGARPGTLAWVDWHWAAPNYIYIDYVKVREDWRQHGAGRQLIDAFYQGVAVPNQATHVDWGRVMSPYAWRIKQQMAQRYPQIATSGHVDF